MRPNRGEQRFGFDSVLFPYNVTQMRGSYAADAEALIELCAAGGVAMQTIKSITLGPWQGERPAAPLKARDRDGVVIYIGTFSKILAPGLRLGWTHCPPDIADVLNRIRGPFNVALPTQAAAIAALEDRAFQDRCKAHNDRWITWFMAECRKLGLEVPESQANFVLVRFPAAKGRDAGAANKYLESQGIIARQLGAYGLPDALRITVGTEAEMRATRDALAAFMDQA